MKHVLITGASTGIGFDACRYLIEKGFYVIGTVRKESDRERLINAFPNSFEAILLDVVSDESISKMAGYLQVKLKDIGLYGLINNAGIASGGPLIHVSPKDMDLQMQTNFNSVFRITNSLSGLLGAGLKNELPPGRIINISSVSGLINTPMIGPYCISKHALESLSDIYRRELALFDIKVILIEPGPIKTPIWEKSIPKGNPVSGTDYENIYDVFQKRVAKSEQNALPVETVSKIIYKALTIKKPSNRYIISKTKLAIKLIHKLMPSSWLDRIMIKQLKKTIFPK